MSQTKISPELLISLVEKNPVIWDKTLKSYKDKTMRAAAWRSVYDILLDGCVMDKKERFDFEKRIVKRWNQIRDSWIRSLHAKRDAKKSGAAEINNTKKYYYHNQMLFLEKVINLPVPKDEQSANDSADNVGQETCEMNVDNTDTEEDELETSIVKQEQIEHDSSVNVNESINHNRQTSGNRFKRNIVRKQRLPMEHRMSYIDHRTRTQHNNQDEERHMYFFKSLLPTLVSFEDNQVLQFQAGVISLLQNIKSRIERSQDPLASYCWSQEQPSQSSSPEESKD